MTSLKTAAARIGACLKVQVIFFVIGCASANDVVSFEPTLDFTVMSGKIGSDKSNVLNLGSRASLQDKTFYFVLEFNLSDIFRNLQSKSKKRPHPRLDMRGVLALLHLYCVNVYSDTHQPHLNITVSDFKFPTEIMEKQKKDIDIRNFQPSVFEAVDITPEECRSSHHITLNITQILNSWHLSTFPAPEQGILVWFSPEETTAVIEVVSSEGGGLDRGPRLVLDTSGRGKFFFLMFCILRLIKGTVYTSLEVMLAVCACAVHTFTFKVPRSCSGHEKLSALLQCILFKFDCRNSTRIVCSAHAQTINMTSRDVSTVAE